MAVAVSRYHQVRDALTPLEWARAGGMALTVSG